MKILLTPLVLIFLALPLCASASVTVGHANTTTLTTGLKLYWSMDGNDINWKTNTIADLSGNGATGVMVGVATATAPTTGKIAQALVRTGAGSTDSITATVNGTFSNFTIAFWQYTGASNGSCALVLRFESTSFYTDNCSDQWRVVDGAWGGNPNSSFGSISMANTLLKKWHHFVFVGSGGTVSVYMDGVFQTSNAVTGSGTATNPTLLVGNIFPARNLIGNLDDIRLYNRALSASEVQQLYINGGGTLAHSNTTTLAPGLVGYWPLDGSTINWKTNTFSDISGNGNTATSSGLSTSSSPVQGKIGQGLKGFTSTGALDVANSASLQTGNTITVSGWFYPTSNATYSPLLSKQAADGSVGWEMANSSGTFRATLRGALVNVSAGTVVLNKWQFGTFTYDGVTLKLYLNGALVGSSAGSGTINSTADLTIGRRKTTSNTEPFLGTLDDIRIYNRVLSASEVGQLYINGGGTLAHSNTTTLTTGLVGYWPLDGNTTNWRANTTSDLSGQGNTGTLVSMSTTSSPTPGKIGQGLRFNGGNTSYIKTSNTNFPNPATDSYTVSLWLRADSLPSSVNSRIFTYETDSNDGFHIVLGGASAPHRLVFEAKKAGTNYGGFSTVGNIATSTWYNVIGTFNTNTNTASFYVNGTLQTVNSFSGGFAAPFSTGLIGGDTSAGDTFPGTIDDMRIYNRALSASEIQQIYNAGR